MTKKNKEIRKRLEKLEDDITTMDLMRMVESSNAFNFWKETGENIYTDQDGTYLMQNTDYVWLR